MTENILPQMANLCVITENSGDERYISVNFVRLSCCTIQKLSQIL